MPQLRERAVQDRPGAEPERLPHSAATTTALARAHGSTLFLDGEGRYEIGQEVLPVDALKFKDSRKYPERLKEALENTGETDALVVMGGAVMSISLVAACFEFDFMGGSMGSVVGERFVRGVETAIEQKVPFLCFTATGGARMQEGLLEPDADGQDQCRTHAPGQEGPALHQRADRPHHGRRERGFRLCG
jgi:acetyl-CoA carboxylase beta subunit